MFVDDSLCFIKFCVVCVSLCLFCVVCTCCVYVLFMQGLMLSAMSVVSISCISEEFDVKRVSMMFVCVFSVFCVADGLWLGAVL